MIRQKIYTVSKPAENNNKIKLCIDSFECAVVKGVFSLLHTYITSEQFSADPPLYYNIVIIYVYMTHDVKISHAHKL